MGLIVFSRWAHQFFSKHTKKIQTLTGIAVMTSSILIGAFAFVKLEGPYEVTRRESVMRAKLATLAKYKDVPEEVLNTFIAEMNERGFNIPVDDDTLQWSLGNAALFCVILITTIGYGHIVPQTKSGKVLVMVYSSIGIPSCLYVLSWGLEKVKAISDYFKINCYYRLGHHLNTYKILVIHYCLMMTLVLVPFFFFPAYVFMKLERDWSYLDALYFVFISCTTIGLGDFVPGRNMKTPLVDLYMAGTIVFIFIGLILAMFILYLTIDFVLMTIEYRKTGKEPILKLEEEEENMPICKEDSSSYGSVTVILPEENNNQEKKPLMP